MSVPKELRTSCAPAGPGDTETSAAGQTAGSPIPPHHHPIFLKGSFSMYKAVWLKG